MRNTISGPSDRLVAKLFEWIAALYRRINKLEKEIERIKGERQ